MAGQHPFLRLQWRGELITPTGEAACLLGHPVAGRSPARPDGVFAEWSWHNGDLTVRNDRYGFYPVYYYTEEAEFAVSPSAPGLANLRGDFSLDPAAMAVFLRLGFFVGNDTPFKGIRALPPDASLRRDNQTIRVSGDRPRVESVALTRAAARDGFIDLFRTAMARRIPRDEQVTVPLSGGKDSRHILLELHREGLRPTCVTMDLPRNDDLHVARQLTRELGVPHVGIAPPASRLAAELRKNRATGFCADEHGWYLPIADYLTANTSTVFDGIGGDVLSCSSQLTEERIALFRAHRFEELARGLWPRSTEAVLEKMLPVDVYRCFHPDLAISRLVEELRDHAAAPNPIGSFFFFNRTRREIALIPYALLRDAGPVHAPFLDHDLYDHLAGLSSEMLVDRTLHSDAIRHAYPERAHIPFSRRMPRASTRAERFRQGLELLSYLADGPSSQLVRLPYLVPRVLRYMADPQYDWSGNLAVYLLQIERYTRSLTSAQGRGGLNLSRLDRKASRAKLGKG